MNISFSMSKQIRPSTCSQLLRHGPQKEKVVVVVGATGAGKSRLSIDLATRFSAEIVNSDKIQLYQGLDIATNKITDEERCGVPHHLLGVVDPESDFSAANFRAMASISLRSILGRRRLPNKTLFLEMESVINLMKQVELKEQAAEQAKSEAAEGGTDVLNQVEELKRMLQRAKETIMRQNLEYRLASALNEIQGAVLKTLEKEEDARKILAEQNLIMEKVVQESKILKQQAEDNAKLQEFLVDRGRVVDALQGEIGVICQDVKLLKEKFDQHVPLGKSPFSGHTSFILASSSSSLKSLVPDQVETLTVRDDEQLNAENNRIDKKVPEDDAAPREDCKAHVEDDEWEFFDSSEVNA